MNSKLRCPQPHLGAPTLPVDLQGGSHRAFTGRRKLLRCYHLPDVRRDDVRARLLELNAERDAEEVALGLHSKAAKQAARAGRASGANGTPAGKRRGMPPKASQPGETGGDHSEQMGLGL
jgi:hypothetical protein